MGDVLQCWKCGGELKNIPLPLSRRQECDACGADQHVCKMCRHYRVNSHVDGSTQCAEDRAEAVSDKERANFCDYFAPRPHAHQAPAATQANAAAKLAELFGDTPSAESQSNSSKADAARDALENLFKPDN